MHTAPSEEYADMSEQLAEMRREMRKYVLAQNDEKLSQLYYRAITLSEHEASRREIKRRDKYGLALMMIREGCADPREIAAKTLAESSNA